MSDTFLKIQAHIESTAMDLAKYKFEKWKYLELMNIRGHFKICERDVFLKRIDKKIDDAHIEIRSIENTYLGGK